MLEKTTDDVDTEYLTHEEKFEFGTSVNSQHKDHVLLAYPFVGGFEIEKATKVLDLCEGTGTALDDKHSLREEIQLFRLQQVASNGRNTQVTLYKCDRETLKESGSKA
jgi:hypothetical protein